MDPFGDFTIEWVGPSTSDNQSGSFDARPLTPNGVVVRDKV